jgi:potassium-transporting ATPase KdpC subunit
MNEHSQDRTEYLVEGGPPPQRPRDESDASRRPPALAELGRLLRPAALALLVLTLLTGLIYPLALTGLAELTFPDQAGGSLMYQDGRLVGSSLIGQSFSDPRYFWGRPSMTRPFPDNAAASGASNLGPGNPELLKQVRVRAEGLRRSDPTKGGPLPVDLVTSSGSGLDPHTSSAAAEWQVPRVARARGLDEARVRELVRKNTEGRQLGFLGEARVSVLELNLALDALR